MPSCINPDRTLYCVECGDPLEDEDVAKDGMRHKECICTCEFRRCPFSHEHTTSLGRVVKRNGDKGPCKGQCGCSCCGTGMRHELARQLWFWHSQDTEGTEFATTFAGMTTFSAKDWNELLIDEEREMWLSRADRVLKMVNR